MTTTRSTSWKHVFLSLVLTPRDHELLRSLSYLLFLLPSLPRHLSASFLCFLHRVSSASLSLRKQIHIPRSRARTETERGSCQARPGEDRTLPYRMNNMLQTWQMRQFYGLNERMYFPDLGKISRWKLLDGMRVLGKERRNEGKNESELGEKRSGRTHRKRVRVTGSQGYGVREQKEWRNLLSVLSVFLIITFMMQDMRSNSSNTLAITWEGLKSNLLLQRV